MASLRYWRLAVLTTASFPPSFSEIAMAATSGGVNQCVGGTATASSFTTGDTPPLATDGTTSTFFAINNGGDNDPWWQYDFGGAVTVAEIKMVTRNDGFFAQGPTSFEVWGSSDGINWSFFNYITPATWTIGATQTFAIAAIGLPASRTQLDKNSKGAGVTINGGSIATVTGALGAVVATRAASGPIYFEATLTTYTTAGTVTVGIANRATSFTSTLGTDTNSIGYRQNGAVLLNAVTLATIDTYVQGNLIQCAYNPTTRQIWFKVGSGNWNASGTANPATGVGGIDCSAIGGSTYPAVSATAATPNQVWTTAFTTFANTAPSGFITDDTPNIAVTFDSAVVKGASFPTEGPARTVARPALTYITAQPKIVGAWYGNQTRVWAPAATGKTISGVVLELGVPVAGKEVRLDEHVTGIFLAKTVTASDGSYSFTGLNPAILYSVMAYDPTNFNALILDLVAPV